MNLIKMTATDDLIRTALTLKRGVHIPQSNRWAVSEALTTHIQIWLLVFLQQFGRRVEAAELGAVRAVEIEDAGERSDEAGAGRLSEEAGDR